MTARGETVNCIKNYPGNEPGNCEAGIKICHKHTHKQWPSLNLLASKSSLSLREMDDDSAAAANKMIIWVQVGRGLLNTQTVGLSEHLLHAVALIASSSSPMIMLRHAQVSALIRSLAYRQALQNPRSLPMVASSIREYRRKLLR